MGKRRLSARAVRRNRLRDIFFIIISVYAALALEQTGAIDSWIESAAGFSVLGSFIAGMFFTSLFTTAPAIIALGELSLHNPLLAVAIPASLGAVVGDLILFTVVRDAIAEDFRGVVGGRIKRAVRRVSTHPFLHWLMPAVGALIISSPLPDELGIAMLGLSKARLPVVIAVSLVMNFIGVILVGLAARAL